MRRVLLFGIAWLLALGQPVAVQAAPNRGAVEAVQQRATPPCSQPMGAGRWPAANPRLDIEENDVGPAGSWGRPKLCVVYFPQEDVYNLMITGTDNVEQFRAAKAESVSRLQARGFDLCRASKWGSFGTQNQPGYTFDDYNTMTVPCGARVRAGDAGAAAHLPEVEAALARAADAAAQDLGYRPAVPVSVVVFTERGAAVDAYKRHRLMSDSDARVEQVASDGESYWVTGIGTNYVYGAAILLNLTDPNYVSAAKIDLDVMSYATVLAFIEATGTDPNITTGVNNLTPRWFRNGVLTRQSYRWAVGGTNGGYLVEAAQAARAGTVPPISTLQTLEQERGAIATHGYHLMAARNYAAVAYLYETYGSEAIAGLLRENRNGSVERFNELLGRLTGSDAAGLDNAITGWLLGLTPIRATSPDGQFKLEAVLYGNGSHGEALVEETAAACLFDVTSANAEVENAPGLVGLSLTIGPDGSYSVLRPSRRSGNAVSLIGRLEGAGQLSGNYRVINEVTGCDSGAISLMPS